MVLRAIRHLIVVIYLCVTAEALVLTLTKIQLPQRAVVDWSYGMMAPYQGDTSANDEFFFEGLGSDNVWRPIDVSRYMPYGFGEANVRRYLRLFSVLGENGQREKYTELCLLLLDRERARGNGIRAVRVYTDEWPRSPAGFWFLHTPLFTTRTYITEAR